MAKRYVVLNEHTLGYMEESSTSMWVLAGKILKGGHDWKNGSVYVSPTVDTLRPATRADFEDFRVCAKGYFQD